MAKLRLVFEKPSYLDPCLALPCLALLVAAVVAASFVLMSKAWQDAEQVQNRLPFQRAVDASAAAIESSLLQAFDAAQTVEMLTRGGNPLTDFGSKAAELMQRYPLLHSIALAPGGTVQAAYPMARSQGQMNWRLEEDPAIRDSAWRVRRVRAALATPVQSIAGGGVGLTLLYPVFRVSPEINSVAGFWGYVLLVVRLPDISAQLEKTGLRAADINYNLSYLDSVTSKPVVIEPLPAPTLAEGVSGSIHLPVLTLKLSIAPKVAPVVPTWTVLMALLLGCAAGLAFAKLLLMHGRWQVRQRVFRGVPVLSQWVAHFDAAHRRIERWQYGRGWSLMMLVRMPTPPARRGEALVDPAVFWEPRLRALVDESDLLFSVRNGEFALLVHAFDAAAVDERLDLLQRQLRATALRDCGDLAVDPLMASQRFRPSQQRPGVLFAELMAKLYR